MPLLEFVLLNLIRLYADSHSVHRCLLSRSVLSDQICFECQPEFVQRLSNKSVLLRSTALMIKNTCVSTTLIVVEESLMFLLSCFLIGFNIEVMYCTSERAAGFVCFG